MSAIEFKQRLSRLIDVLTASRREIELSHENCDSIESRSKINVERIAGLLASRFPPTPKKFENAGRRLFYVWGKREENTPGWPNHNVYISILAAVVSFPFIIDEAWYWLGLWSAKQMNFLYTYNNDWAVYFESVLSPFSEDIKFWYLHFLINCIIQQIVY